MKGKAMTGGIIGLVLVGAFFLSNLFKGVGLGPGSGTGTGQNDTEPSDPSKVINSTEEPDSEPVSKLDPAGVEMGKVVMVLIDGENYKVLKAPDADFYAVNNYRPATLEQIVQMAKSAEGVEGLKVKIGMRENSTHESEMKLRNALFEAGLPRTAVYEMEETIP